MSREHVIPLWVSGVLAEDPRVFPQPVTVQLHHNLSVLREITGSDAIQVVTRRVCKICNEGWMEKWLESTVRPFLDPMIRGQRTELDVQARTYLAAWAAKVAMVGRYALRPPKAVDPGSLAYLYEHHLPPPNWHVFLASYEGRRPAFYQDDEPTYSAPDGALTIRDPVVATLVVGYVAFTVVRLPPGTFTYPSADRALPLWPPFSLDPMDWPLPRHLDDGTLPAFASMYVRNPGEPPRPLPD